MTEQLFQNISHSLVKKYLSKTIFEKLKTKKTSSGYTLRHAIQSGVLNPDSEIGIYAGDAESYVTFSEIFDPIIADYHAFTKEQQHTTDLSFSNLPSLESDNRYILSTRIRVARNIEGFPFTAFMSSQERYQVEQLITEATKKLPENLQGCYLPLKDILKSKTDFLKTNFFPKKGDRFLEAAGINREFPDARGIFLSHNKKFMIWTNEEDHIRIISMESGSNLSKTFNRLSVAIKLLEKSLKFSFYKKYGYLTSCPSNIGISMRASVHIKLPGLNKQKELLYKTAEQYKLQIRGTSGEKTSIENSTFDISNKQRLGINEQDCLA
ncbi:MAG: arginine kinase, partial [Desulfobacteraceae bacterium]|nr:arginine kinase [Desulfobacteraceae bacterium]